MLIIDHFLCKDDGEKYPFVKSPNVGGRNLKHEYLIMHYTVGQSAEGAVSWLTDPKSKVSAHIVIGRDGEITQLVPFDTLARHAGVSSWKGRTWMNKYSIGIELDNAGSLKRADGAWLTSFGRIYPDEEVIETIHKHRHSPLGWHIYPQEQIEAAIEVATLLVDYYGLIDVIGHEDVSPANKTDPGPAFPMASFRARVIERENKETVVYKTRHNLTIRPEPGTQSDPITGSPVPEDTQVEILDRDGRWAYVHVLGEGNEAGDMRGWVYGRYLLRDSEGRHSPQD